MSDTPRTDAHTRQLIDILQHPHWIDFARSLERENVCLRGELRIYKSRVTHWQKQAIKLRAAINAARREQP
jgi:hypothetical protein